MSTLSDLRKFIQANQDPENLPEIRSYIEEHLAELAYDLGVTTETITTTLEDVKDDSLLATKILAILKKAQASRRDIKREGRARGAQAAADALASRTVLDGERVQLDVRALLSSVLTKRSDLLVFTADEFSVSVPQGILFDVAKLKHRDLTGFVDAKGLHIRWRTGGLNLRSQIDPGADCIVINLPRRAGAVAA